MNIFQRIVTYFKNIFSKKEKINFDVFELHNEYQKGDIIIAKRYSTEEEKERIPVDHRISPYIVWDYDKDGLICYYCGSSLTKSVTFYNFFPLNKFAYDLNKDTYVRLDRKEIINKERLCHKVDFLSGDDINNLERLTDSRNGIDVPLSIGDYISYHNQNYIVNDINNDEYICFLTSKSHGDCQVTYLNKSFNIKFNNTYTIKNEYLLKAILNEEVISNIKNEYNEYLEFEKRKNLAQRGSIIELDKKKYYIYGEEANEWLLFKLEKQATKYLLTLEGQKYYTLFQERRIDKNSKFNLSGHASESEMNEVQSIKKEYRYNLKKQSIMQKNTIKNQKKAKKALDPGTIISNKHTFAHEEYIVLYDSISQIYVVDKEKYDERGFILLKIISDTDAKVCGQLSGGELYDFYKKCKECKNIGLYLNIDKMDRIEAKVENKLKLGLNKPGTKR